MTLKRYELQHVETRRRVEVLAVAPLFFLPAPYNFGYANSASRRRVLGTKSTA